MPKQVNAMRVTKSELAKALGVSRSRVSQYSTKGMPFGSDGRITLAAARQWIADNLDPGKMMVNGHRGIEITAKPRRTKPPSIFALMLSEGPLLAVASVAEAGGDRTMAE